LKSPLNILIACDTNKSRPWFRDRIPSIEHAISQVEWSCEVVDIYGLLGKHEYMPTDTRVRKKFMQSADMIAANKNFEIEVIKKKPNVLILGTADNYRDFLMPSTVSNIRKSGIYVVGILGDDEFNYPQYRYFLGWFDLFVAYVKPCLEYYESFNLSKGYYFPNSCFLNDKKFSEFSQQAKFDVVLVGAPFANRPVIVKALIESGLKVAIYGSKKWEEYDFADGSYFGFVDTEDFDKVLEDAKIVLALLEDHLTGALHMNTKIWEAVRVARLPVVTLYERLTEDYELTDGIDVVMYKNTQDLVAKVKYYIENDDQRIAVAKALYNKVEKDFEYALLYKNLFNKVMDYCNNVNSRLLCLEDNVLQKIEENESITYIPSKSSSLDPQVINYLQITDSTESNKIDLIYFDRIENGSAIILRKPFINFDSIVFLTNKKSKLSLLLILIKACFLGRTLHIKQFGVLSNKRTILGFINICLDRAIYSSLGTWMKKKL